MGHLFEELLEFLDKAYNEREVEEKELLEQGFSKEVIMDCIHSGYVARDFRGFGEKKLLHYYKITPTGFALLKKYRSIPSETNEISTNHKKNRIDIFFKWINNIYNFIGLILLIIVPLAILVTFIVLNYVTFLILAPLLFAIMVFYWKRNWIWKKIHRQFKMCEECQGRGKVHCKKCKTHVSMRSLSYSSELKKTNRGYILKINNVSIENNGKFPVFSNANIRIKEHKDYGGRVLWKWSKKNVYLKGHKKKDVLKNKVVTLGKLTKIRKLIDTPVIGRDIIIDKFPANSRISIRCNVCDGTVFNICDICKGRGKIRIF